LDETRNNSQDFEWSSKLFRGSSGSGSQFFSGTIFNSTSCGANIFLALSLLSNETFSEGVREWPDDRIFDLRWSIDNGEFRASSSAVVPSDGTVAGQASAATTALVYVQPQLRTSPILQGDQDHEFEKWQDCTVAGGIAETSEHGAL
jgi:hypothetical protein